MDSGHWNLNLHSSLQTGNCSMLRAKTDSGGLLDPSKPDCPRPHARPYTDTQELACEDGRELEHIDCGNYPQRHVRSAGMSYGLVGGLEHSILRGTTLGPSCRELDRKVVPRHGWASLVGIDSRWDDRNMATSPDSGIDSRQDSAAGFHAHHPL